MFRHPLHGGWQLSATTGPVPEGVAGRTVPAIPSSPVAAIRCLSLDTAKALVYLTIGDWHSIIRSANSRNPLPPTRGYATSSP